MLSWPLPVLLAGLLVSLGAGVVRGFTGFGYSALTVAGLAVFVTPATVVPAVLMLEIVASLSMLRAALRSFDRDWLRWLLLGNLVFVPVGIALLALLPQTLLRLLVGGALLVSALVLRRASEHRLSPTLALRAGAGVASGLLTGLAASGGVAAALVMAAAGMPPARLRSTMVTFLFVAGIWSLLCAALLPGTVGVQLLTVHTLRWALLLAPTMLAGIWIGRHAFSSADPAVYRRHVLSLLMLVASLGLARAVYDLALR